MFRAWGLDVWGLGLRIFRVSGLGLRILGMFSALGVKSFGLLGLGFGMWGL